MKRKARLFTASGFGLVLILVLAACGRGDADGRSAATGDWEQTEAPALAVEGMEVTAGTILRSVEGAGIIEGINEATVVSEVQGTIESISFELGEYIEEGTVLARVDDAIARLSREEARYAAESARLDLVAAERRLESGSASQAEVTRARTQVNGALARLEAAEEHFRNHSIRSPIAGFIASREEEIGRGNYLNPGEPIARVVDLSSLRLEIAVGERELGYINEGARASVTIPVCGTEPIDAVVASIAAGADRRTGSFPVVIEWENSCDRARSGMSARVALEAQNGEEYLIVPNAAVRSDTSGTYVFLSVGETAERRDVGLGSRLGERVEVTSGLESGDVVIISALSALSNGAPVRTTVIGRTAEAL